MDWIEVEGAYGRDYTSQKAMKADWDAEKDFRDTASGSYVSKVEAQRLGLKVIGRYKNHLNVMTLKAK